MRTLRALVEIEIEMKDETDVHDVPFISQVTAYAQDHLDDVTKHDSDVCWRVRRLTARTPRWTVSDE